MSSYQDLDVHFVTILRQVLPLDRHTILASEEIMKGKHAHGAFFFARSVWFSHSACFDALAAPAAVWNVSTRTVILDLCGCWLAGIGQDFAGCAPLIFFFSFSALVIFRSPNICSSSMLTSSMVAVGFVKKIFQLLFIHRLQPVVGREDHLSYVCWWAYALAMTD